MQLKSSTFFKVALKGGGIYAAIAGPALAVDGANAPQIRKAEKPRLPVFAYKGAYAGLNVGGASWRTRQSVNWPGAGAFQDAVIPGADPANPLGSLFPENFGKQKFKLTFGAQVGYNLQVENFLLGLEADVNTGSSANVLSFERSGTYMSSSTSIQYSSFTTTSYSSGYSSSSTGSTLTSVSTGSTVSYSYSTDTSIISSNTTNLSTVSTTTDISGVTHTYSSVISDIYQTSSTTTNTLSTYSTLSTLYSSGTSTLFGSSQTSTPVSTFGTSTSTGSSVISTNSPYGVLGVGRAKIDWINTIRTRFGFVADRTLFYVTGGLAIGQVSQSVTTTLYNGGAPYNWSYNKTGIRYGFALGGGIEHALSDDWSVRAQYLYYNLGTAKQGVMPIGAPAVGSGMSGMARTRVDGYSVTFGVNYHFRTN